MSNPGLQIPDTMGVEGVFIGQQKQQEIRNKWYTSTAVEQEVSSWGFPPLGHPGVHMPIITPDLLSGPDTNRYTEVYQQVSAWLSYAENQQARLKARILEVKNEMGRVEIEIKNAALHIAKQQREKRPSKEILDGLYKANDRWQDLLLELQREEQKKLHMDSHVARLERDWKLLSRQIEIRKEETTANRVGNNMGYRGTPAPGMYQR